MISNTDACSTWYKLEFSSLCPDARAVGQLNYLCRVVLQLREELLLPEDCEDAHDLCATWAKAGECEKNPGFMRGDSFSLGGCRLSCGVCTLCAPGDRECRSRNRVEAGYLSLDELDLKS